MRHDLICLQAFRIVILLFLVDVIEHLYPLALLADKARQSVHLLHLVDVIFGFGILLVEDIQTPRLRLNLHPLLFVHLLLFLRQSFFGPLGLF